MNTKIIAAIVAGLVALPMAAAASTLTEDVVTGHTVYANMGGFDPDVALIAGIVENKVVWFNGVTVLSTLGSGYVYAVEEDQCSPLTGTNYTFLDYRISYRDPNNIPHIVAHYDYECATTTTSLLDSLTGNDDKEHVWITLTHDRLVDPAVLTGFNNAGRVYNFGTGVDTSFFDDRGDTEHTGYGGSTPDEVNDGDSYCPPEDDHVCNGGNVDGEDYGEHDESHEHNTGSVDLYFSKSDKGNMTVDIFGNVHYGTGESCKYDTDYCAIIEDTTTYPTPDSAWAASW